MSNSPRPMGIAILSILGVIGGLLLLLAGGLVLGATSYIIQSAYGNSILSSFLELIGSIFLLSGALSMAVSWGMWYGKGWAWTVAVVLYVLDTVSALFSAVEGASVVGAPIAVSAIGGLFLYPFFLMYLSDPDIRSYFGKRRIDFLR